MLKLLNEPLVVALIFFAIGYFFERSFEEIALTVLVLFTAAILRNVKNTN